MSNTTNDATGAPGGEGGAVPYAEQVCENCRNWISCAPVLTTELDTDGKPIRTEAGECRAKPPRVARDSYGFTGEWPSTAPSDWCAAWTDRGRA